MNPGEMLSMFLRGEGGGATGRSQTSPKDEDTPTHADVSKAGQDELLGMFFDESTWKGLPNHVCVVCEAGFLDPDRAIDHVLTSHGGLVTLGPEHRTASEDEATPPGTATGDAIDISWPEDERDEQ